MRRRDCLKTFGAGLVTLLGSNAIGSAEPRGLSPLKPLLDEVCAKVNDADFLATKVVIVDAITTLKTGWLPLPGDLDWILAWKGRLNLVEFKSFEPDHLVFVGIEKGFDRDGSELVKYVFQANNRSWRETREYEYRIDRASGVRFGSLFEDSDDPRFAWAEANTEYRMAMSDD
jgi:hypothetical protein